MFDVIKKEKFNKFTCQIEEHDTLSENRTEAAYTIAGYVARKCVAESRCEERAALLIDADEKEQ